VRSALGASGGEILRLIMGQGMVLSAVGVVLGLFGSAFATRALVSLLFGVSRPAPATYAGGVALLGDCRSGLLAPRAPRGPRGSGHHPAI
jgi:putative ABC transport system permease protein